MRGAVSTGDTSMKLNSSYNLSKTLYSGETAGAWAICMVNHYFVPEFGFPGTLGH